MAPTTGSTSATARTYTTLASTTVMEDLEVL